MQTGKLQQFWWCGQGRNPEHPSQDTDSIQYATVDLTTQKSTLPQTVMAETPGTWDTQFTCNPKVIRGVFANPRADGESYSYAMYYVATSYGSGTLNDIGVAFSNDGITWKKYPNPVIYPTGPTGYGAGQPAVYNRDHKSEVWVFYENSLGTGLPQHLKAVSTDGIHFSIAGKVTTNGIDLKLTDGTWGDMAYDPVAGYWYAVFNMPPRLASTTGGIAELGQPGVVLYRIPDASLLTGAVPWQELKIVDTNSSGHESVFIPGFLRNQYGELNVGPYPAIQMFTSMSNPAPSWNASPKAAGQSGNPDQWDVGVATWNPSDPAILKLNRYANSSVHEVTTGWIDPAGGFKLKSTLGQLYATPQNGADLAFFACKRGSSDYFVSTDLGCGGEHFLGVDGYGYSRPPAGASVEALYSCATRYDHFVSTDRNCEGLAGPGQLLGYGLPE